jgi:hypothetical protein
MIREIKIKMDDLFSILIYLIIIISFLSSIFKKKKTQGPPQQQQRVPQDRLPDENYVEEEQYTSKEATEYDILREIENMFKTEEDKRKEAEQYRQTKLEDAARRSGGKVPSERISYEQYASSEDASFDANKPKTVRDYSERKVERSEHTYTTYQRKPKKVDRRTEEQAKKFQDLLDRRSQKEDISSDLVRKIKDPKSFREFILVSEILARPKALRR